MSLLQLSGPVILDIPTDPASLFLVRGVVERLAQRMDYPPEDVNRMVLAVDEACTNVIRHAYANSPDKRIVITFTAHEDRLEIGIRDFGIPADPDGFAPRDLQEVKPGGLGLHFIRSAMDEITYDIPADGGMLLRLVKYRTHREEPRK
ncbi:ATP-binding protein [Syntrophobacter fumaroxidans]|uniref:Putative anti-sigma regulatory factor, serine/threonine protein kinase n=1 Tax=Syntrophobacter fumaroxidans (strain DSM 10017 / MPOB) TaxID=335543 RepID=A0LL30_SYNFM|nr:ATP-binding protein [Syntrophobacter fumaroxidans]ABK18132.1 putative anti-sigma regulatory factor, serine/threonine protein kinase [Syntrophobacter fumaroxidans MPOB]